VATVRSVTTCRWAESRLLVAPPLWLEGWLTRWCCIRRGEDCVVSDDICRTCPRWEPRLEDKEP
jgi:hypothetical protein